MDFKCLQALNVSRNNTMNMDKFDFKQEMVNQAYFNYPSSLQQLSNTNSSTIQIPEHLELIKCSLCEQTIDMYIDIDADVFKRFYCVACIRNKKITPFSKDLNSHLSSTKQSESLDHSMNSSGSQTKSQACQSNLSSPYFNPRSSNISQIQKSSKSKQKHHAPLFVPCDECCSPPIITCSKYSHFLESTPSHNCEKGAVNKRSWSVNNRRPWSHEQKETIFAYFREQIENHASIGKEDIIPLMQLNKDLYEDRTWKEIKWVYYHHLKVLEKRKQPHHGNTVNIVSSIDSIVNKVGVS